MDAISAYSVASLAWLAAQAVPLIIWPSLVATLLRVDSHSSQHGIPDVTLEQYFARSLGLAQLALSVLLLILSGALPLDSAADTPRDSNASQNPYASAAVLVSTLYHAATASYSYSRYYTSGGQLGYLFGCLGASVLAAFGLFVVMFAGEKRVSRRTGADKNTSGWPFRNAEADRKRR